MDDVNLEESLGQAGGLMIESTMKAYNTYVRKFAAFLKYDVEGERF